MDSVILHYIYIIRYIVYMCSQGCKPYWIIVVGVELWYSLMAMASPPIYLHYLSIFLVFLSLSINTTWPPPPHSYILSKLNQNIFLWFLHASSSIYLFLLIETLQLIFIFYTPKKYIIVSLYICVLQFAGFRTFLLVGINLQQAKKKEGKIIGFSRLYMELRWLPH